MIPQGRSAMTLQTESEPSLNHKMHMGRGEIYGNCDGLPAMEQVVYKILFTERYRYVIYSWNYGIELNDLFGEPKSYVCPELERRITEALVQDDRIDSVDGFSFDCSKSGVVSAYFTVHTPFGDIRAEKGVSY